MAAPVVEVVVEAGAWDAAMLTPLAERACAAALRAAGAPSAVWEVALLATDDAAMARLNAGFRGRDRATNVLSWPAADLRPETPGSTPRPPETDADLHLGDIALGWETCRAEAIEADRPLAQHLAHLIVHALLHLLGYDHGTDADATLMEGLERIALAELGVPDPY
ncbi:MAG: rRNA maturation RNase YbeY [Pseudomonadota bacterium]